uniref:SCR n=2 Tax=Arabidopsis thaliana TaxID=3702 RepID=A7Y5V4_ARATH|nr:SCR-B [Arabidopsis thaliana]ABV21220.1 SCR [Arabidopsis thaliana]ABY76173.1 SCR-B [Arabidopsis thaliana]
MKCAVSFMVSCFLIVFFTRHIKELEAQKWKACLIKQICPGSCRTDGYIRCKNDITKNGKHRPFECKCKDVDGDRLCFCYKCLVLRASSDLTT